jgi:hypothetical protein
LRFYDGATHVQTSLNAAHCALSIRPLIEFSRTWLRRLAGGKQAYRPERHYMRGPGPKWHEKRALQDQEAVVSRSTSRRNGPV